MYVILAFLIGFSIVGATVLNGKLAREIGVLNGVVVNFIMGTIGSIGICILAGINIFASETYPIVPIYYFLGGAIGVMVTLLLNICVQKVTAVHIVILPFIGQILTSAVIDYFALQVFSIGKLVGGILFLIGLIYNTKVDEKYRKQEEKELEDLLQDSIDQEMIYKVPERS